MEYHSWRKTAKNMMTFVLAKSKESALLPLLIAKKMMP